MSGAGCQAALAGAGQWPPAGARTLPSISARPRRCDCSNKKSTQPEVLLYPPQKQFYFPAPFMDRGDCQRGQVKVVRQKHKPFLRFRIMITYAPQCLRVISPGVRAVEPDGLVAAQCAGFVRGPRLNHIKAHVFLGAGNKPCPGHVDFMQAFAIHIAAIQRIVATRGECDLVKEVDIMHAARDQRRRTPAARRRLRARR